LPAAGFDDCEHRLIPSCSIPASDFSGPAFSSVVMDSIPARSGSDPVKPRKNKQREKYPAPGGRTYSRWTTQVKANWPKNRPNVRDLAPKEADREW
jgi:hypothetical protein